MGNAKSNTGQRELVYSVTTMSVPGENRINPELLIFVAVLVVT